MTALETHTPNRHARTALTLANSMMVGGAATQMSNEDIARISCELAEKLLQEFADRGWMIKLGDAK